MQLIDQMIIYKLGMAEEDFLNREFVRGIWNFYCSYNLACVYLGIKDPLNFVKNRFFFKILVNGINEKYFNQFKVFMNKDQEIILNCLRKIEEVKEIVGIDIAEITYPGRIGVLY